MQYDTFLFDAYGTLFQLELPDAQLDQYTKGQGEQLMAIWRRKQLEYTWLRSLMQDHANFEQVSEEALRYAMAALGIEEEALVDLLMPIYRQANCFEEVPAFLKELKERGMLTAILSNGTPGMLEAGVKHAGLDSLIDHVFSVESIGIFKPFPAVYQMAISALDTEAANILFISANAWDVAGAANAGLPVAWINRKQQVAEHLPHQATLEVNCLADLFEKLEKVS